MQRVTVGGNVDSWCTRCKLMLAHTIESLVGGKITRVHCNTCGAQHAYRAHPPGEGSAKPRGRGTESGARAARKPAPKNDYATLMEGKSPSQARPYSTQERFRAKELLRHPVFGLGIVILDKGENKIEVLFPDGPRVLVHGR